MKNLIAVCFITLHLFLVLYALLKRRIGGFEQNRIYRFGGHCFVITLIFLICMSVLFLGLLYSEEVGDAFPPFVYFMLVLIMDLFGIVSLFIFAIVRVVLLEKAVVWQNAFGQERKYGYLDISRFQLCYTTRSCNHFCGYRVCFKDGRNMMIYYNMAFMSENPEKVIFMAARKQKNCLTPEKYYNFFLGWL